MLTHNSIATNKSQCVLLVFFFSIWNQLDLFLVKRGSKRWKNWLLILRFESNFYTSGCGQQLKGIWCRSLSFLKMLIISTLALVTMSPSLPGHQLGMFTVTRSLYMYSITILAACNKSKEIDPVISVMYSQYFPFEKQELIKLLN